MTGLLYIAVGLCLVVFQTIVRPSIPMMGGFFDLFVLFVVYLSLFRSARESLLTIFCLGFVVDNLSSGPFGLYLTTYLWLFIAIRWLGRYLRLDNAVLLPLVIVASVLLENVVILGSIALLSPAAHFPKGAFRTMMEQLVWALTTGAFLLTFLACGQGWIEKWSVARMGDKGGEDE